MRNKKGQQDGCNLGHYSIVVEVYLFFNFAVVISLLCIRFQEH